MDVLDQMIIPKVPPANRAVKRRVVAEMERVAPHLLGLEQLFVDYLFANPKESYNQIYQHFLAEYTRMVKYLKTLRPRVKLITFDERYFVNRYAPLEQEIVEPKYQNDEVGTD